MSNSRGVHLYVIQTGKAVRQMAEGIGCNILATHQGSLPPLSNEAAWQQVMDGLDDLKIGWMRASALPGRDRSWNDETQTWDFSTEPFQCLRRIGHWAKANAVHLMIDPFSTPRSMRSPGTAMATDPNLYAERFILTLAEWTRNEGLDSCVYLGLLNESIWGPNKDGFDAVPKFHAMFEAVRRTLDKYGFENLGLLGPSALCTQEYPILDFFAHGLDPDPLLAGYDQHFYGIRLDWIQGNDPCFVSMSELTDRYIRNMAGYAHNRGKPFFITEMGTFYVGRLFWGERDYDGPSSHTSLIMDAELIVRGINNGADGFLRWAFSVRPDFDGAWSLMDNRDGHITPSAEAYPLYRMLMRAIRPRATVLKTNVDAHSNILPTVHATALVNPDGNASVVIVNDFPGHNVDIGLELGEPFVGKQLYRTVWDETRKGILRDSVTIPTEGEGKVCLTPYSVTVLSTDSLG